jgi:hypothetical protein
MSDAYPEVRPLTAAEIIKGVDAGRHLPDSRPPDLASEVAAADRFAAAAGYTPGQPIDDVYRQRTYHALLSRGEPTAEAQRKAEFWARLKASSPEHVHGPAETIEEAFGLKYPVGPSITTDPDTGMRTYNPGYQPQAAATGLPAGGPPTILEYTRNQWIGMNQPVNRFSANPGAEYYAAIPGSAPTMFNSGDLPVISGSGVDPSVLRWVAWPIRHTAAFSSSRSEVAQLIELSLEGDPEAWYSLTSEAGRDALNGYWARIANWVSTPPPEGTELTEEEIARFYPEGSE